MKRTCIDTIGKPAPGNMRFDFEVSRVAYVTVYAESYREANQTASAYF